MRPRPGPSDLRYSNLQPNKELKCTEKQRDERDKDAYDSSTEEGEVESSEDELPPEDELTNVLFSENENNVSTPLPGPSRALRPNQNTWSTNKKLTPRGKTNQKEAIAT